MARYHQLLAYLTVFLLILKTTYASLGFCIGLRGPSTSGRETVGFKLWNDHGEETSQYRVLNAVAQTTLHCQNWTLNLKFTSSEKLLLDEVFISNPTYGEIGKVVFEKVCQNDTSIYYGCLSNDIHGYCQGNRKRQIQYCKTKIKMGIDSVRC
ncbi:hypothetical protein BGX26_006207 [Mortierella sp. AD094]|nr:hypothetical protein BGX26_006207 [Mortierella sp. AD094]